MSTKSVKFRKDSPTGGSSRGSGSHIRSDSGAGSLSDRSSYSSNPDRDFTASEIEDQRFSIAALQEAHAEACSQRDIWKGKAHEVDIELRQTRTELRECRKDLGELDGRWKGVINRSEILEQERDALTKEKNSLARENQSLHDDNESLRDEVASLRAKLSKMQLKLDKLASAPGPAMSGANGGPSDSSKPKRTSSKREKEKEKEREARRAEEEKEKLRERFQRSDESDASKGSGGRPHRSRRQSQSYIEPLGPSAARPVPGPTSPIRTYPAYTTAPSYQSASYTPMRDSRDPVISQVPRTVRPTVQVESTYEPSPRDPYDYEDGNYNIHPLPGKRDRKQ